MRKIYRYLMALLVASLVIVTLTAGLAGNAQAATADPPITHRVRFSGVVKAMPEGGVGTWTITTRRGDVQVEVTADTRVIRGPAAVGDTVLVVAQVRSNEEPALLAEIILVRHTSTPSPEVVFRGVIRAMDGNVWTIGHARVVVTQDTLIEGNPHVGDMAEVHAVYRNGQLVATRIRVRPHQVEFRGVIESIGDSTWTVGGREVTVTEKTTIIGDPQVGAMAEV
ncbi:MAG: hypothetical protein J7M34_01575, partial [Anaerolineae bacterium]|nr:hypothetical protein [Anaerolineae bacterium]